MQESLARLINAMASLRPGRDYLAGYRRLVETLIDCLVFVSGQMEAVAVEMIIAVLQKLSLKYASMPVVLFL